MTPLNQLTAKQEKIVLMLLPFWTPLIPPLGITCLKSHLQKHGFSNIKTIDVNVEEEFRTIYDHYFDTLKQCVPEKKRGNFYNVGAEVLQNHMMAHQNQENETQYGELVKILVNKTFFSTPDDLQVRELSRWVQEFYHRLAKYMEDLLEREKPALIGFSLFSGTLPASMFAARITKEKNPRIKTVVGGGIFNSHLEISSDNFQRFLEKTKPFIDHILIGEGEILFYNYLCGQLPQSKRVYGLQDLDYQVLDLAAAEIPDFSDLKIESYPDMGAYSSRSCPFQCSFCSEAKQWGKFRKKAASQIVEELVTLYRTYGHQLFLMGDSLLNPVATDLAREFIKTDVSVYWDGYLRADPPVCHTENTLLWRRGGFYRARLGVESGSPHVLGLMGKKITPGQINEAISSLAYAGIKTTTYWVIGYPGESEEDFLQTLELIKELKNNIYEAECNPFTYYPAGQVMSEKWAAEKKRVRLYPEAMENMLITQTWILEGYPPREEIYSRVRRFTGFCQGLGIPNPYSLHEIHQADERWKKLHQNAVPSLIEFKEQESRLTENKDVKELVFAHNILEQEQEDGECFDL